MPYVLRDKNGCIVSVMSHPGESAEGRIDASDDEIREIFGEEQAAEKLQEVLVASDLSFVRVLEDLIGVMLDKGIIKFTDLPDAAREKMLERRNIRSYLTNVSGLIEDTREDEELYL